MALCETAEGGGNVISSRWRAKAPLGEQDSYNIHELVVESSYLRNRFGDRVSFEAKFYIFATDGRYQTSQKPTMDIELSDS